MSVIISTSGWHYRDWKQRFYPEAIPQREWLAFYADHFTTVESNYAFYRLPEGERSRCGPGRLPPISSWP